jgi:TonB family protein
MRDRVRFILTLSLCLGLRASFAQTASDYQVEAAYLYNFAKLGEWPPPSLPDGAPLIIGVVGGDHDFIEVMEKTVAGKFAGTHSVVVRHLTASDDLRACQILFFRASERKHSAELIATLGNASILLVGEDKAFLADGGMINLLSQNGSIRFELNPEIIERAGIRFSPQVLAQAKIEHTSPTAAASPSVRKVEVRVAPDYPELAQRMNLKGTVQVQAIVGRDGTVKKVNLIGGHPLLAEAAIQAVLKWKYEPAPGETVEVVKVSFGEKN